MNMFVHLCLFWLAHFLWTYLSESLAKGVTSLFFGHFTESFPLKRKKERKKAAGVQEARTQDLLHQRHQLWPKHHCEDTYVGTEKDRYCFTVTMKKNGLDINCRTFQAFTHLDKPQMRWSGVHHILKESEGKKKEKKLLVSKRLEPRDLK